MKRIPNKRNLRRRGAALVEFAVASPIVFTLFFAAFEFSRVAMIRHTADNAAYEGARQAIIPGGTAADASQEAQLILSSLALNQTRITVTPSTINENTDEVTVRVEVPLDANTFVPNRFVGGQTVVSELTMRREGRRP